MASVEKSFEDLVKEAQAAGTVSLVGALGQSSEEGKFVLTPQGGSPVTLETASVKGHSVLGTWMGHTIVRIDVDPAKIPAPAASGAAAVSPFVLATPHQAPASTLAAVQQPGNAAIGGSDWSGHTVPAYDYLPWFHTVPAYDYLPWYHTVPAYDYIRQ